MSETGNHNSPIVFGPFRVDVAAGQVHKNGRLVHLPEQPFQVLVALVEHPGEVVTREELQEKLRAGETQRIRATSKCCNGAGIGSSIRWRTKTNPIRHLRLTPRHSRNTPNRDARLNPDRIPARTRANSWPSCLVTDERSNPVGAGCKERDLS